MSETHIDKQTSVSKTEEQDMDLGVLFNMLRSLFNSIVNGIYWLIKSLFNLFITFIIYIKNHLLKFVIAAIIGLIFGYLWYSPLFFGNVVKKIYSTSRKKSVVISLSFLLLLVVSYFIAFLEIYLKVTSFWDGVVTGILLWIGFILPGICQLGPRKLLGC